MLDQIIYTRCFPHRDLKNKGQVIRMDGFGIFSMSRQFITDPPIESFDLLQSRLALQNGAKEASPVGLFNSYEYFDLSDNVYAISYEVARPHCKEPRSNGQSHRTGTYIKQCFVGNVEGYPCDWFGSSEWNAHLKTENEYYLDNTPNAIPEFLGQVTNRPGGGYINRAILKNFAADGRTEAVKAGIWFLMQEYSKPENERKVLLIKDVPENVEKWIAAIMYGFSEKMARSISFTTNRSKLGTQADNVLFYYTDRNGHFCPMLNRSIEQIRHPYNMIVGFHPKDNFCSSIRQMPTSNFGIIDGTSKTVSFEVDALIHRAYFAAVIQYDEDIQDFCELVLPSMPKEEITAGIPELYDACKYLLDSDHKADRWDYRGALSSIKSMTQFGISDNVPLNQYIVAESMKAYVRFVDEDERQGYILLRELWKIARTIGHEYDITGCLADRLSSRLNDLRMNGSGLAATWYAIQNTDMLSVIQPALLSLFNDTELGVYRAAFERVATGTVFVLLDIFFHMLDREYGGILAILQSDEKYEFVCRGVIALIDDKNNLNKVLATINTSQDLMNGIVLSVSEYLDEINPAKTDQWINIVLDQSGGNMVSLCQNLCKGKKVNIERLEHLLAGRLAREGNCSSGMLDALRTSAKILGKTSNTGLYFFETWISVGIPHDLAAIIREINGFKLSLAVERNLFRQIDNALPLEAKNDIMSVTYEALRNWGKRIGLVSQSLVFYDFKRKFDKERKLENAVNEVYSFTSMNLAMPENYLRSNYFHNIAVKATGYYNGEMHLAIICMFQIKDLAELMNYVSVYIHIALSEAKSRQLVYLLCSLCDAITYGNRIGNCEVTYVNEVQGMLEKCLRRELPNYLKPGMAEQVSKSNEIREESKVKLISMLEEVEKSVPSKRRLGGLLSGLFGKK